MKNISIPPRLVEVVSPQKIWNDFKNIDGMSDFMPDTWGACYKQYIMDVINTLTDGQFCAAIIELEETEYAAKQEIADETEKEEMKIAMAKSNLLPKQIKLLEDYSKFDMQKGKSRGRGKRV